MSAGPIGNNPDAVAQVGGVFAGLAKKGIKMITGGKSSRTAEMTDSARLHKTVLAHQKAEHTHTASEAALDRAHEQSLHKTAMEHAAGYNSTSAKTIKTQNLEVSMSGNKTNTRSSSTTKPKVAKTAEPAKPATKSRTKPVIPAESVKVRKRK